MKQRLDSTINVTRCDSTAALMKFSNIEILFTLTANAEVFPNSPFLPAILVNVSLLQKPQERR